MRISPFDGSGFSTIPAHLFDSGLSVPRLVLDDYPAIDWKSALTTMITIREVEDLLGQRVAEGIVKTPVHLSIGQEAVPTGVALSVHSDDYAFGNHRSHGHYLALGGDVDGLLREVLGKASGCSHGMGGSMHITAPEVGFVGSVPIVAGTIPIAVGAGLYAKLNTTEAVGVAFFGDGAVEEGVFHEAMNFAATHSVPVVFVCENNIFSSHMHLTQRQPFCSMARFAFAHGVHFETVDGNDVTEVHRASSALFQRAREDRVPVCLEAVTYRWRAHVGPPDDLEIGLNRSDDLPNWRRRDPIQRLASPLRNAGEISEEWVDGKRRAIRRDLERRWEEAEREPYPSDSQLLSGVHRATDAASRPSGEEIP